MAILKQSGNEFDERISKMGNFYLKIWLIIIRNFTLKKKNTKNKIKQEQS